MSKRSRWDYVSPSVKGQILLRDNYVCWICGKHIPARKVSLDHVIPRSKGGLTNQSNLRAAHRHCNTDRGNAEMTFNRQYRAEEIVPHIKTYPASWVRTRLHEAMLALDELQNHFESLGHEHKLIKNCYSPYSLTPEELCRVQGDVFPKSKDNGSAS